MKILFAAPQDETAQGIIAGYCADDLRALGHEVALFDFRRRPYSSSKFINVIKTAARKLFPAAPSPYDFSGIRAKVDAQINRMLLDLAGSFRPEVVLVFCGENIVLETLETLRRELKAVTVCWMLDTLFFPYRLKLMRELAPGYDYVFLIDSLEVLKKVEVKFNTVKTLPTGCQPFVHKKLSLTERELSFYGSDVAFVGTVTPEREKLLEQLSEFDLKIWGRWHNPSPNLKKCYCRKDVYGQEAVKIYNASKIILGIHSLLDDQNEIYNVTPRVFEVPASGGFLLTNLSLQIGEFYRLGEEMVVYNGIDDLKRLISYYLSHEQERDLVAQKACLRAHAEHSYQKRLEIILNTITKGF